MAKKYYAVRAGKVPGIYQTWDACKKQVDGFSGAAYKSFLTLSDAQDYMGMAKPKSYTQAELTAYVDGSYNIHTREFSYGVVLLEHGNEVRISQKVDDPSLSSMRNVAGEIKGAQAAMEYAVAHGYHSLEIHHDYEGISKWCLGEWKTNKDGTKAYKEYYDGLQGILDVTFIKVKGHSGDKYNDIADQLAKAAIF